MVRARSARRLRKLQELRSNRKGHHPQRHGAAKRSSRFPEHEQHIEALLRPLEDELQLQLQLEYWGKDLASDIASANGDFRHHSCRSEPLAKPLHQSDQIPRKPPDQSRTRRGRLVTNQYPSERIYSRLRLADSFGFPIPGSTSCSTTPHPS